MESMVQLGEMLPRFGWEILMAIICGGLIGIERELRTTGGLRNSILICLGTVLYMIVAELISISGESEVDGIIRMASHIVIGIGLLGAGVMLSNTDENNNVHRAGTFWVVAAIGLIIGTGNPMLGLLITGVVLLTLTLTHIIEKQLKPQLRTMLIRLTIRNDSTEIRQQLHELLEKFNVHADSFRVEPGPQGVKVTIKTADEADDVRILLAEMWKLNGVMEVEH